MLQTRKNEVRMFRRFLTSVPFLLLGVILVLLPIVLEKFEYMSRCSDFLEAGIRVVLIKKEKEGVRMR